VLKAPDMKFNFYRRFEWQCPSLFQVVIAVISLFFGKKMGSQGSTTQADYVLEFIS